MVTAAEIARSRVMAEDVQEQAARIARYQDEIDEALNLISEAKKSRNKSTTLTFFKGHEFEKAKRVREALIELGYDCSKFETRRGEWSNGFGYHSSYYALDVTWKKPYTNRNLRKI